MQEVNGHALATVESDATQPDATQYLSNVQRRTADLVSELHDMLGQEEIVLRELMEQTALSRARRDRLEKTLAALTAETTTRQPKHQPAAKKKGDWQVSEDKIDKVLDGIREFGPIAPTHLSKRLHIATESANKAIAVLREREQIRVTKIVRGGGKLYAVMPSVEDQAHAA